MRKIFILSMLIAPIVAHATDPIGPAHVNSGAVVATASAPYATATEQTGDSTTVVSASYVKGAYNDAIAAVNKVNADKQDKLYDNETGYEISNAVLDASAFNDLVDAGENHSPSSGAWQNLVSAQAIANQIAKTKLLIYDSESSEFIPIALTVQDDIFNVDGPDILVNGMAVQNAINSVNNTISAKRVSAVTTWGNDTPTKLQLTNQ